MALLKKSASSSTAVLAKGAKRAAPKAAAKKAPEKVAPRVQAVPRVSKVTAGGYTVYGSPVQPKYRTARQITDAIAELD
jgi:hypothetical protein